MNDYVLVDALKQIATDPTFPSPHVLALEALAEAGYNLCARCGRWLNLGDVQRQCTNCVNTLCQSCFTGHDGHCPDCVYGKTNEPG